MVTQHNIKRLLYGLVAILVIGSGFLFWRLGSLVEPVTEAVSTEMQDQQPPEPVPVRIEARWLLAGEVFWGRRMEQIAQSQGDPYAYLFSQLETFERETYDAWMAHLECPITDTLIPFATQRDHLVFNCRPEYVEEFARWFDVVSLANNHMDNVNGVAGIKETRQHLEASGVQYYGHFDNSVRSDICEVVSLPARLIMDDESEEPILLPVAACGYNNVFGLPTAAELDEIKRYSEHFFTIVSPQQGAEYQAAADDMKRQTYRTMVDRGADLVVASHPHWVQDTEAYNGKLIMYSVGNFMFDQEWSEETKRGAALDLTLTADYSEALRTLIELGQGCSKFKDDCLAAKPYKPDFKPTFELVSSLHENALTRKAPVKIHELNLERTNWEETNTTLSR